MRVAGIVAEYNPFHNGHLYHLNRTRELCSADYVVCVMSGNFIQRGEPAIVNKWARAKMALLSGADLVLELPVVYAMASAEFFAWGAVKILDSIGVVDNICFGSECGEVAPLEAVADILAFEPDLYKELLREKIGMGISYPSAREEALKQYCSQTMHTFDAASIEEIIGSPNNILGIEYIKALKKLNSKIKPVTVKRICNSYNSEELTGAISSATSIRKHIYETIDSKNGCIDVENHEFLPETSFNILAEEFQNQRGPVSYNNFSDILLSIIRKMTLEELKDVPYVSEGLENRIKDAANNSGSFDGLLDKITTKRYTGTRIKRSLFSILAGIKKSDFEWFNANGGPQYIRVLGFNENGKQILAHAKKTSQLPIIVKAASFKNSDNPLIRRMLEIESAATDMYVLGYRNPEFKKAGQEFTQNVIRV
ncbi:MAG TPA: nucleotidyltransferase [Clostridiaceae bacterium]|nr:nucleotidyltransferase [Clostridiaceae bacterium]